MAGLNPPPAVQSVLSTPSPRQRQRSPSISTDSTPVSSSLIQVSPTPLTVEGLLKQHATASDPKAAALDQAISERNVLSSQNTQLWKLIEKQRAGYNQILKELERIRGERDSYKSKLSALNAVPNGSSSKQQKSSTERTSRPSLDTVTSQTSSTSQSRQTYTRHNSDDSSATPRTSQYPQHLHSSRSFDSRSSENVLPSTPRLQPPTPGTRQFRPSPSPLVVPPRGENILLASSTQANSPDTFAFSKQPPTSDPNTTPNNSAPNGIYPSSVRPLAHPRKPSVADSFTSVVTSGSSVVTNLSHRIYPRKLHLPDFNASPLPQDSRQRTPSSAAPLNNSQLAPPTIATPTNSASAPLSQQQIPQPQPNMLSAVIETRSHILSRDSRISLPDEARQYIVNMADSPVASPRTDHFSPRSKLSNSVFPSTVNGTSGESGRESEFLDMEEEDESDEESDAEGPGDVTAGASDPAPSPRINLPTLNT
ncbi:hypothetical protein NLJ89_g11896 [Agrocybe chaxingu]|uniref:Uncharacterized protein n=1 Tax=Agrocybe chaxingu TaxID=84603 RepID=A0A9W8JNC3_9AGAR|nr:hypothetical protein NLJ89_g11896 [Agrocybe chaxingu]